MRLSRAVCVRPLFRRGAALVFVGDSAIACPDGLQIGGSGRPALPALSSGDVLESASGIGQRTSTRIWSYSTPSMAKAGLHEFTPNTGGASPMRPRRHPGVCRRSGRGLARQHSHSALVGALFGSAAVVRSGVISCDSRRCGGPCICSLGEAMIREQQGATEMAHTVGTVLTGAGLGAGGERPHAYCRAPQNRPPSGMLPWTPQLDDGCARRLHALLSCRTVHQLRCPAL